MYIVTSIYLYTFYAQSAYVIQSSKAHTYVKEKTEKKKKKKREQFMKKKEEMKEKQSVNE